MYHRRRVRHRSHTVNLHKNEIFYLNMYRFGWLLHSIIWPVQEVNSLARSARAHARTRTYPIEQSSHCQWLHHILAEHPLLRFRKQLLRLFVMVSITAPSILHAIAMKYSSLIHRLYFNHLHISTLLCVCVCVRTDSAQLHTCNKQSKPSRTLLVQSEQTSMKIIVHDLATPARGGGGERERMTEKW